MMPLFTVTMGRGFGVDVVPAGDLLQEQNGCLLSCTTEPGSYFFLAKNHTVIIQTWAHHRHAHVDVGEVPAE